ncbi:hypothetical protein Aduo_015235 [Ancylostoma duodenale]
MISEVERAEEEAAQRKNRHPAIEMISEENRGRGVASGQYALPTSNEVAIVYVGEDNDVRPARSLAIHLRGSEGTSLINISDIDKRSDFLVYPLLFSTRRGGWDLLLMDNRGARIMQIHAYTYIH